LGPGEALFFVWQQYASTHAMWAIEFLNSCQRTAQRPRAICMPPDQFSGMCRPERDFRTGS